MKISCEGAGSEARWGWFRGEGWVWLTTGDREVIDYRGVCMHLIPFDFVCSRGSVVSQEFQLKLPFSWKLQESLNQAKLLTGPIGLSKLSPPSKSQHPPSPHPSQHHHQPPVPTRISAPLAPALARAPAPLVSSLATDTTRT